MKQKRSSTLKVMLLSLACLIGGGCGHEEILVPEIPDDSQSRVVLTFNTSPQLTTRTQLPGSDNLQHVRDVQLYIFEGTEGSAQCVASEDVGWRDKADANGLPTREQRYPVKYTGFINNRPYTFLAIGLDDASKTTYDLPAAVAVGNTTLADAKAILAAGKTKADIAVSEFFGGSTVLTPNNESKVTGIINLYRRVAGVMGWFKNIPRQVNGTDVASLRIELYKAQNKSIWLSKPQTGEDVIMEPVEETDDNKILVQINLVEDDFAEGKIVSKGSYVLPMIAPFASEEEMRNAGYDDADIYVKDYTLRVILAAEDGTALRTKRVVKKDDMGSQDGTDGGTGIINTGDAYRFPIKVNWFYGIGSKENPVEFPEEGDNNIVITVNPDWEGDTELTLE